MTNIRADLIYDIGLHNGSDTAYYLFRGYKVLAVDADPVMIEKAERRFAKEVRERRLTLLNVGVGKSPEIATFWTSDGGEWSSFDKNLASRFGVGHTAISVKVVPLSQILAEYGVPHYLKIDIEGNDGLCVEGLKGSDLPTYISVESECAVDSRKLSNQEAVAMLELLHDVGYRKFKLVAGGTWISARPKAVSHLFLRLAASAAHGRLRVKGLSKIAYRFTDASRVDRLGYDFTRHSSGPWGEDIPGSWMSFEKARQIYLRERAFSKWLTPGRESFWYDWHATY